MAPSSARLTKESIMPGNLRSLYCSVISHAVKTAVIGFKNSDGCKENPKMLSRRRAPFISAPQNNVQAINVKHKKYPTRASLRLYKTKNIAYLHFSIYFRLFLNRCFYISPPPAKVDERSSKTSSGNACKRIEPF